MKLYISEQDNLILLLHDDMSICSPVYRFFRHLRTFDRAFNTLKSYAIDLKVYFEYLQHRRIQYLDVSPKILEDYRVYLLAADLESKGKVISFDQKRTYATVDRMYGTVELMYTFLQDFGHITSPVLKSVEYRRGEYKGLLEHTKSGLTKRSRNRGRGRGRKPQYNLISESDADALEEEMGKYGEKYRMIFKIMRHTGARIQEVLDLKISQIPIPDVDQDIMVIYGIKSKGKERDLYMPEFIVEDIDNYIVNTRSAMIQDGGSPYLFVSESKNSLGHQLTYDAVYAVLVKARDKLGINCNFHDLRHTFCTNKLKNGMPVEKVKEIMGHERISTTMTYTHFSQSDIAKEIAKYWDRKRDVEDDG